MQVINTKIYGGELVVNFNQGDHIYKINGVRIPSVTGIIGIVDKPFLIGWAARMAAENFRSRIIPGVPVTAEELDELYEESRAAHRAKKTEAGDIGTKVHNWCEMYIKGSRPEMPTDERVLAAVQKFLNWVEENDVKFLSSEQIVYSRLHNYVGTVDFFCVIKGKLYIGDIKTANAIYMNSNFSQIASYLAARQEEYPQEKYSGGILLRLGKDNSELEVKQLSIAELQLFHKNFINCLYLYQTEMEIRKLYPSKHA